MYAIIKSFLHQSIKEFSTLPIHIKNALTLKHFGKAIKTLDWHILSYTVSKQEMLTNCNHYRVITRNPNAITLLKLLSYNNTTLQSYTILSLQSYTTRIAIVSLRSYTTLVWTMSLPSYTGWHYWVIPKPV